MNTYSMEGKAPTSARLVALQNPIAANYEKGLGNIHKKQRRIGAQNVASASSGSGPGQTFSWRPRNITLLCFVAREEYHFTCIHGA